MVGWPEQWGGRNASIAEQVIFAEEYARAKGPPRVGHLGVELIGPTLLAMGSEEQNVFVLACAYQREANQRRFFQIEWPLSFASDETRYFSLAFELIELPQVDDR